jgi:homoserine kinase type II
MAVYTVLDKRELADIVEDYGLARLLGVNGIAAGSVNTTYLLDTPRGKHLVRIDEVKGELEVKRELDLLLFLRKHGFPCPQPLADRKGRHYRELGGKCLSVYRWYDGHALRPERITGGQLENIGRVLADLHTIGKSYKKGIENRFSFERVADLYAEVRGRLPAYFKRIVRTLDDEVEYLRNYLESKLPKGIIHGDLFHDNLIVKGEKVVAVLDFEAASRGKFIFDLATAVNALCSDGEQYDLKRFEALIAGYESLRALSLAEWDAFPNELRFSALRFTVTRLRDFFLNPVDEQVRVNKDFREFYERLRILRREREGGMDRLLMAMATGYDYRKYQKVKALEKKGSKS